MNLILYFDGFALLTVIGVIVLSSLVYLKSKSPAKLVEIANFSIFIIFALTLVIVMHALANITSYDELGQYLAFAILANLYCVIFNIFARILQLFK